MMMSSSLPGTSGFAAVAAQPGLRKPMWRKEEDHVLREQVRLHGPHNWDAICLVLPERNSKSCRLRWCQHLDPMVDAAKPFTPQEDMLIIQYQATFGNRWSTIAGFLPGRTDNAVKNRWNSVLYKRYGHANTPPLPRQYWAPSAASHAMGPEVTLECLPLFPLENGDVRMDRRSPPLPTEDDLSEDETCAAPMECLQLFPRNTRVNAGAAASSDMSCGADNSLTQLRLAPTARMVFDVMSLQAYRM